MPSGSGAGGSLCDESDHATTGQITQGSSTSEIVRPDLQKAKKKQTNKQTNKQKLASQFKPAWGKDRPWLLYVPNEGMYCKLCQKCDKTPFGRTAWNRTPSVRIRLETVKEHERTEEHADSVRTELITSKSKNVAEQLTEPAEISRDGMVQAFMCLYWVCKNHIPHTTNFPKLLDLETLLGVDIIKKIRKGKTAK